MVLEKSLAILLKLNVQLLYTQQLHLRNKNLCLHKCIAALFEGHSCPQQSPCPWNCNSKTSLTSVLFSLLGAMSFLACLLALWVSAQPLLLYTAPLMHPHIAVRMS